MINEQWTHIQEEGAKAVNQSDIPQGIRLVAGVDVAYSERLAKAFAAVVVFDLDTRLEVERKLVVYEDELVPYVAGYFSFRELPVVREAIKRLEVEPDVYIIDGVGVAHPRGFGLASHAGVALGIRTIGCAKTTFTGKYAKPDEYAGSDAPIWLNEVEVGRSVRTQTGVSPVYVSVGHNVSLDTSVNIVLRATGDYRLPEPIRAADHACRMLRKEIEMHTANIERGGKHE